MSSHIRATWRKTPWYGKIAALLAALFILYVAVGFLVLPPVIKSVLVSNLREQTHREARVEQVSFNPFTLRLEIQGLEVRERDEDAIFFSLKRLVVDKAASSLFKLAPVMEEVTLDSPYAHIRFLGHGRFNFSDLLTADENDRGAPKGQQAPSSGLFPFLLENFSIQNATIRIDDDPMGKTHMVEQLELRVPFTSSMSSYTEKDTLPTLNMLVNGSPISLEGSARPFKSEMPAAFSFSLKPFKLAPYWDYLPVDTPLELEGGFLSADVAIGFERGTGVLPILALEGNFALRDATLNEPETGKALSFEALEISNATFRLPANMAEVGSVVVNKPNIRVTRLANGEIDWAGFFTPQNDTGQATEPEGEPSANATAMPAFGFKAGKIAVRGGRVLFMDKAAAGPTEVKVSDLNVAVRGFALPLGEPVDLEVEAVLKTSATSAEGKTTQAALNPLQVTVTDFRLGPHSLEVEAVNILAPRVNLEVAQSGSKNTATPKAESTTASKVGPKADKAADQSAALSADTEQQPSFNISVGKVTLDKGRVHIRDTTLKPAFDMKLGNLGATITGFDTAAKKPALLKLKGMVDGHAPLGVEAHFHSAMDPLSLQADMKLNGLDMVGMTPLTLKHIAYPLLKGKLSTDIQTDIQNDDLKVDTSIDILQLEVGDKVDNPEAADIPMGLALALLQDPAGNIRLDVPVAGKLSDPQFRLGKVIVSALVNVLIKIITSPFALLGGLFEGAEDADLLTFAPGKTDLEDSHNKPLEALASAMQERPRLELEVAGFAPRKADKAALAEAAFLGKLQMQKYLKLQNAGKAPSSPREVEISPEEYPDWLEEAYGAEEFDKPKNMLGLDADVPMEEMERLMREHIQVTDHDLRDLALTRAGEVRNYLLEQGELAPERVFLVEEPGDTGQGGRVELRFK